MKPDAKYVLSTLIKKYERSKLSKGGSEKNLHIRFVMSKEMPQYDDYENYADIRNLENDIREYESRGWVQVVYDDGRIRAVELVVPVFPEAYMHLHTKPRLEQELEMCSLCRQYIGCGIDPYVKDVLQRLEAYKSIKSLTEDSVERQERLLKALSALVALEEDTLQRVFSARVLGDSKAFEEIRSKVIKILRSYVVDGISEDIAGAEEESDKELLARFHLLDNPGHLILKGCGTITIGGSKIDLNDFTQGMTLSTADVEHISSVEIEDDHVMTIENLTSFYQYDAANTFTIYLGGYHNAVRRKFLIRLYGQYPEKEYLHFGDIDAGGFYILEHLKAKTGIPFRTYLMDIGTLQRYTGHTKPLTGHDHDRLKRLLAYPEHAETIQYMLDHNVKLEQEQVTA